MLSRRDRNAAGPPPGWYGDPRNGGAERYWDGSDWAPDPRQTVPIAALAPVESVRIPDASSDFFALPPAAVAAVLLDLYGELGEIRMNVAVINVAERLDGEAGLSESRRRQVSMMVAEACNLLERVGAVCHRADTEDHRILVITNRGHRFWAMDDPVAALSEAAGD